MSFLDGGELELAKLALVLLFSFFSSLISVKWFIRFVSRVYPDGHPISLVVPESHKNKRNTPSMGGVPIFISLLLSSVFAAVLFWGDIGIIQHMAVMVFTYLIFSVIGLSDDLKKIRSKKNAGMRVKTKFIVQLLFAVVAVCAIQLIVPDDSNTSIKIFGSYYDISYLFYPFAVFTVLGSTNATNITDGLDGLAALLSITVAAALAVCAYISHESVAIISFCISIAGSTLGFLWFNAYPAKIFMGDTGSLAIGASLAAVSVFMKQEVFFAFISAVLVFEVLSVILQVASKKIMGKKIFKMSPIHHHFELSGVHETTTVIRFWITSVILAVIGLIMLP